MSYCELLVALVNIIIDKVATVPTATNRNFDTSAPMEIGMAAKDDSEQFERSRRSANNGHRTAKPFTKERATATWFFGKGHHWIAKVCPGCKGGNDAKDRGKNSWQKGRGMEGGKGKEKIGKGEARACWTSGKTGHIAA